ncbi:MAG: helix-turn-helix domain-containing protein [Bacillota bacterium]
MHKQHKRDWLIKIRKARKLTQETVATKAFIDRAYYAQIESGVRNPSEDIRQKIAQILNFHSSAFNADDKSPFRYALEAAPMIIAHCDMELKYTWIFNHHPLFPPESLIGKRDDELGLGKGGEMYGQMKRAVIEKQISIRKTVSFSLPDQHLYTYMIFAHPLFDRTKQIIGAATILTELSKIPLAKNPDGQSE